MGEYRVKITEWLETTVSIESDSADTAVDMVRSMYRDSDIILTADNHVDTKFTIIGKTTPESNSILKGDD